MNNTLLALMTGTALIAIAHPACAAGDAAAPTSPGLIATAAGSDPSSSAAKPDGGGEIKLAAASVTTGPPANAATAPTAAGAGDGFGTGFFQRLFNYEVAELGRASSPINDPNAPASRRSDYPPQPVTQPPYPFTEWPYGAATLLGVSRPNAVDSPLMVALAPTGLGKLMQDAHIQAYGWVEAGGNLSTNHIEGGNAPAGYDYNPNTVQLDQAVLYIERVPDTVQTDHIDWGFRLSGIYGVDYRYTTSYGLGSYQLTKYNRNYGWDVPMEYVEVYDPHVAKGLLIRAGRFISIPDIEAQLAPNNYMYSHSLTYTFDNFTNTGVMATLAATKNLFLQLGVVGGTDTLISNIGRHETNPYPNPLYPGTTFLKDPGAKPSVSGCVRYQSDSARDNIYLCADAINNGVWGYNNLQWYGGTYYHKFTDKFHIAVEIYNLHQSDVPNANNTTVQQIVANGGTPFSGPDFRFNAPDLAQCKDAASLKCTASVQTELVYWNYQFSPLDNLSLRTEYYDDMQGQRTGVASGYEDVAVGVQHWLSPQIELRPEVAYYRADAGKAFGGNGNHGIAPNRQQETVLSGDIIVHF